AVSAASMIPLLWLVITWLVPFVIRGGVMPKVTLAFWAFITVVGISSALAFFLAIPPFRDIRLSTRELQAFLTLGVGAAFYLVSSAWPGTSPRMRTTLQIINWSGLVLVGWSLLQGYFWFFRPAPPAWMWKMQEALSLNTFFYRRVDGFAFEPSWLGHQLNMLYLPFWLAATVQRTSAHRFRLVWFSLENLLLLMGAASLFLSFSRVGMVGFLLVLIYLGIRGGIALGVRVQLWLASRFSVRAVRSLVFRIGVPAALIVSFLAAFAAGTYGMVHAASRFDPRIEKLLTPSSWTGDLFQSANNLAFAERVVFWATGWEIFNQHPLLGVGLGNAGYYFPQAMPAFGWSLTEVNTVMYRTAGIPNTKSLWTRILAETGIAGFATWLVWLYLLWQAARLALSSGSPVEKTVGLAGTLMLVALLAEGFSVDSFALPYLWVTAGLVSAASSIVHRQARNLQTVEVADQSPV
ncbi:MAG TPA: O-antigen ligase family protein, partial [Anaerolineaceae bacterium]